MKNLWIGLAILFAFALVWAKLLGHGETSAMTKAAHEAAPEPADPQAAASRARRTVASGDPKRPNAFAPLKASAHEITAELARETAALSSLQSESSISWVARRADASNRVRTLARGAWRFPADTFIQRFAKNLFGVSPANLKLSTESVTDRARLTYQQSINGTEVYGATLSLFYDGETLSRVQNDLVDLEPHLSVPPTGFAVGDAFVRYKANQPSVDVSLKADSPSTTVLYRGPTQLIYAYEFSVLETSREEPKTSQSFVVLYDAEDPHVIKKTPTEIQ